ncbi:phosphatase [Aureococcus anophagefferens]|nr:phosphatase [Aureococcus anophagefferens]
MVPVLLRTLAVVAAVAAHAGHGAAGDAHDHVSLESLGLVLKNAYGAAACDAGACVLEPYRETVVVAALGAEDLAAQSAPGANSLALRSDLEAVAHSLTQDLPPDRRKWMLGQRRQLADKIAAAEGAEAGPDGGPAFVFTLQKTPEAAAGEHTHDGTTHVHAEDKHTHDHDHEAAAGEHTHDGSTHVHAEDEHTHDHAHEAATGEHTHDGTTHVHAEDKHTHDHAHEAATGEHTHDGTTHVHAEDKHTHDHDHEAAAGEHTHDGTTHVHAEDEHTHDHAHEAATGEHTHDGSTHVHAEDEHTHGRALEDDGHCHDGDCHTHGHAHEAAAGEHTHDGSTHVHAEDAHDHGDGACAAPVALGSGRRGRRERHGDGAWAYTLVVSVAGDESRRAVFAVDVRFARRAATEMKPGDRSRFLRAVSVLYNTSAAAGRDIYGDQFRTMDELWAAHALLGGDGAGHVLQSGALGGDDAEDLLAKSEPHRAAVQSVDPAVAVPYWAEGADAAVPEKTWTEDFTADPSKLLGAPPGDGGAEVKIAVEGKWAYLPVFEKDDPLDPKNPRGPRKYQGYAVPLMVAESDPIAANPFETHKTLPPIAVDHHHDAHASGSQLHHTHSGKAHRHV